MPKNRKRGFIWTTFCSCYKSTPKHATSTESITLITEKQKEHESNVLIVENPPPDEFPVQISVHSQTNDDDKPAPIATTDEVKPAAEELPPRLHQSAASVAFAICSDENMAKGEPENEEIKSSLTEIREEEVAALSVRFETEEPSEKQMLVVEEEEVLMVVKSDGDEDASKKLPAKVLFQSGEQNPPPNTEGAPRHPITPELQQTLDALGITSTKQSDTKMAKEWQLMELKPPVESPIYLGQAPESAVSLENPPVEIIKDVKRKTESATDEDTSEMSIANNEGSDEHITEISQLKGQNLKWKIIIKHHMEQDEKEPVNLLSEADSNKDI